MITYSDHYSCLITLSSLPRRREGREEEKIVRWNLAKEGGWKNYEKISEQYKDMLDKLVEDDTLDIEEKYTMFEKILDKIKFKSFGKVTLNKKNEKKNGEEDDDTSEEEKASSLLEAQENKMKEELDEIRKVNTGKIGRIWRMRTKILGRKKEELKATAIINPDTHKLEVSKQQIKQTTLKYCVDTLKNNEAEEEFKDVIENRRKVIEEIKL